jgi:hypothetical protein
MAKILILSILMINFALIIPVSAEDVSQTNSLPYYQKTAVGPYQRVGTLAAIQPLKKSQARQALILLPGLNSMPLAAELYEWKHFWEAWQNSKQQGLDDYKLYVFRYDGWDSVHNSSCKLELALRELLEAEPQLEKLAFIGYSQGGLLPRILLTNNQELERKTTKVITFATPHQGAIVLTEKLVQDTLELQNPFIRFKNRQALKLLSSRYYFAYREQAWTNFDKGIPAKYYTPPTEALNLPVPQNASKYITYGSYYQPPLGGTLERNLHLLFAEMIPRLVLNRRAGTKELGRWMGKKVYPDEAANLREHLKLNDGVTPLVSALWGKICSTPNLQPANWQVLFPSNDFCPQTNLQRAFKGIDHLAWRESSSAQYLKKDLLHPNQKAKTPYDWMITDLLASEL